MELCFHANLPCLVNLALSVFLSQSFKNIISFSFFSSFVFFSVSKFRLHYIIVHTCLSLRAFQSLLFYGSVIKTLSFSLSQATEWVYDPLQQEEGEVQKRWLLLEEEERWENHAGGSHEAQSTGSGGEAVRPHRNTSTRFEIVQVQIMGAL